MSSIDRGVLARAREYAREFAQAQPFRHVTIPDFLERGTCERLLADFPRFEERHALNERGEVGGKAVRMDVRELSDAYRQIDRYLQGGEFLGFVSAVTGIPDLLYDPDYVGGGTHENRQGQSLDAHVDFNYHPRTRWHRRLNLIVYLNPLWQDEWGGLLDLHSDPWDPANDRVVSIAPLLNRCVIFETTETSWHGFGRIELPPDRRDVSRKSFAIYLYTRERPAEETAPPHATIYVPDTAPSAWQAGRVLDAADAHALARHFGGVRTQLRYLYEREKRFGKQIAELEKALDQARAEQRLPLQGYAVQPAGARGFWPDGWAGAEFSMVFVPTRPARALRLDLWGPSQHEGDQELQIQLGERGYVQVLRPGRRTPVELPLSAKAGQELRLTIRASRTWTPAADGQGEDRRALAYKIVSAELVR